MGHINQSAYGRHGGTRDPPRLIVHRRVESSSIFPEHPVCVMRLLYPYLFHYVNKDPSVTEGNLPLAVPDSFNVRNVLAGSGEP